MEAGRRLTCGWTSQELAWKEEETRRKGGWDSGKNMSAWIAQRTRKEYAVQSLSEDSFKRYVKEMDKPADFTRNVDGFLHHGDVVRLKWISGNRVFLLAALPSDVDEMGRYLQPCRATATGDTRSLRRSAVQVYRNDMRIPSDIPLMSEECLCLSTIEPTGKFFLSSELRSYQRFAPLSEHQEVTWSDDYTGSLLWKILQGELNAHSQYIQVNREVALNHVTTNQNLAVENFRINTMLGEEQEITAHSSASDSSSTIGDMNLWQFVAPYEGYVAPHRHDRISRPAGRLLPRGTPKAECFSVEEARRRHDISTRFHHLLHA